MNKIRIAKRFNNSLMLRNEVKSLSFRIRILSMVFPTIILDFDNVDFIARSSAHEFILLQRKFPKIKFSNRSQNVKTMFDIVANSKKTVSKNVSTSKTLDDLIAIKSI
jgi:hypothetical protein